MTAKGNGASFSGRYAGRTVVAIGAHPDDLELAIGGTLARLSRDGVRVVIDRASLPFVQGTRVDLVQEGLARRVRFDNPNARQTCGCGESFGVA